MIKSHEYGDAGPVVLLLHGGPGAGGYLGPVAETLADSYHVFEPLQRGSGTEPLTVARHVEDLRELVEHACDDTAPVIIGHSWGAMLALAFAAAHPDLVGPLVLVGCGTFHEAARAELHRYIERRMDDDTRQQIAALDNTIADPNERLRRWGELITPVYSVDLIDTPHFGHCDRRAHEETFNDMLRLQAEGMYPKACEAITSPVLMLHGDEDPHPGTMIRDSLLPHLPQLEYVELARCGHFPWLERHARDQFTTHLRHWLECNVVR